MANTYGQYKRTNTKPRSEETRRRLLDAAAVLIAELGWGRVTTRAVAEHAGLPHGAVSYHFRGKQELLTEAALQTIDHMFPTNDIASLTTLADLFTLSRGWMRDRLQTDPVGTGVLLEAMRESERNPALRHHLASGMRDYRRVVTDLIRAQQRQGDDSSGPSPSALATLIVAMGDGLGLHAILDPDLDVSEAFEAMLALMPDATSATEREQD